MLINQLIILNQPCCLVEWHCIISENKRSTHLLSAWEVSISSMNPYQTHEKQNRHARFPFSWEDEEKCRENLQQSSIIAWICHLAAPWCLRPAFSPLDSDICCPFPTISECLSLSPSSNHFFFYKKKKITISLFPLNSNSQK